jgi:purine-binding chemotaxis protein CheW
MRRSKERLDLQKSLVGFLIGDVQYAVPISHVREIINPVPLVVFPHAPDFVAGVADYRGEVTTVIDLPSYLGQSKRGPARMLHRVKWVVVQAGDAPVSLVVDHVTDVFGTQGRALLPPPALAGTDHRGVLGVLNHGGTLTYVLDVARFETVNASLGPPPPISERAS